MSNENGTPPAAEIKAKARKLIEAPSGNKYLIRRVMPFRFIAAVGGIPELGPDVLEKMPESERVAYAQKILLRRGAESTERVEKMLKAGLVAPAVGDGPDQIGVDDIPAEDIGVLLNEITELTGVGAKAKAALDPTSAGAIS
mgnify:CR=1 FL=1